MADYEVTSAALVAKLEDGGEKYFYRGESLSGVADDEVDRLKEIGLIKEAGAEEEPDEGKPPHGPRQTTAKTAASKTAPSK